ncbi:MAG TPA: hypothetical protein VL882_28050 [Vicinamibacterales bacterium]|jgi:hypothetical protein|nr:hypothetical protein [Vicinamibacterales bacterium]
MPSEVRFTRAQKWDLVRISAAAVASTVFFTVPMFLVRPHPAAVRIEGRAPESRDIALATDRPVVSVVTATEFAIATTPAFQGQALARSRNGKPAQVRARATTPAPDPPSLKRRLTRFLAGDGKYNVRPFPTVSTSGS